MSARGVLGCALLALHSLAFGGWIVWSWEASSMRWRDVEVIVDKSLDERGALRVGWNELVGDPHCKGIAVALERPGVGACVVRVRWIGEASSSEIALELHDGADGVRCRARGLGSALRGKLRISPSLARWLESGSKGEAEGVLEDHLRRYDEDADLTDRVVLHEVRSR